MTCSQSFKDMEQRRLVRFGLHALCDILTFICFVFLKGVHGATSNGRFTEIPGFGLGSSFDNFVASILFFSSLPSEGFSSTDWVPKAQSRLEASITHFTVYAMIYRTLFVSPSGSDIQCRRQDWLVARLYEQMSYFYPSIGVIVRQ